jgi:hydrogenase 3 maturation protease
LEDLRAFFTRRLKGVNKLAILGVGSVLRADDGAGIAIVENLSAAFGHMNLSNLLICAGETAPENFSGKIREFRPGHLLVVDAADICRSPGEIVEIDPEDVGGPTFCSHLLPLRVMINYLAGETGTDITLLGIQHKNTEFDTAMSPEVQEAAGEISGALQNVIEELLLL